MKLFHFFHKWEVVEARLIKTCEYHSYIYNSRVVILARCKKCGKEKSWTEDFNGNKRKVSVQYYKTAIKSGQVDLIF